MATQMTVWRPFADFGELRHRIEGMFHQGGIPLPESEAKKPVEIETKPRGV